VSFQKLHPYRQRQAGHPRLRDAHDPVRRQRAHAPGGVAGFHVALRREAQDHFLAFGIRHDSLEHAVENEVLLHLAHALRQQEVALVAVLDQEVRFELVTVLVRQEFENLVLLQLEANDRLVGMARYGDHVGIAGFSLALIFRKLIAVNCRTVHRES
jgi:hypothetical protein